MVSIEFCRDIWIQSLEFFILLLLLEFHPFHTVRALKNTIFLRSFLFFLVLDLLRLFLSCQVVFWTVSTASMRAILWISVSGFLSFMVVVLRYLNKSLHSTFLLLMSISCSVSVILIVITLLFFCPDLHTIHQCSAAQLCHCICTSWSHSSYLIYTILKGYITCITTFNW